MRLYFTQNNFPGRIILELIKAPLFVCIFSTCPYAAVPSSSHSVSLELFGRYLYFAGISYEYHFSEHWSAGTGFGIMEPYTLTFDDKKSAKGLTHTLPLYISAQTGEKHVFFGTAGCTFVTDIQFTKKESEPVIIDYSLDQCVPFISAGYQHSFSRFFLRVPVYLFYTADNNYLPVILPFIGLTAGIKL